MISRTGIEESKQPFHSYEPLEDTQYMIDWDCERSEWDRLLEEAGKSNLLQSWAYGEAKASVEGWKVSRGLILHSGCIVAMLQILEKSLLVVGGVVRINRGPLWLHESASTEDLNYIYALIRRQWSWQKRRILLIAPELQYSPEHRRMLTLQGYHLRRKPNWHSVLLDLGKTDDELRKGLKKKWRNMLSFAERADLRLNVSFSDEDFQWLVGRYKELMLTKGFQGISIDLLCSMRKHLLRKDHLLVMQAISETEPVAGVLIARHGLACTYLVGWNGTKGRTLKAHNFLLWNAALEMKRRGCLWLDLGGISEDAPEIAAFKLGMSGEEYKLIGEYLCV